MDRFINIITTIFNGLLPPRCLLCKQPVNTKQYPNHLSKQICHYCDCDLARFDYQYFSNLLLRPDIGQGIKQVQFNQLVCVAPYQWPFSQWIAEMKFKENFAVADLMAQQLVKLLIKLQNHDSFSLPQVILPMPIHRLRQFTRGYNQAQLIADVLAESLNIPLNNQSLHRVKATNAQSSLGKAARRSNVKQAFAYQGQKYHHVALVDDVITTGATVNEACKILKQQGIEQISVWTICATPAQRNKT